VRIFVIPASRHPSQVHHYYLTSRALYALNFESYLARSIDTLASSTSATSNVYLPSPPFHLFSCPRLTHGFTSGGSSSPREAPDDDDINNDGSLISTFLSTLSSLYSSTVSSLFDNTPSHPQLSLPEHDTTSNTSSTMTHSEMPIPSTPHVTSPSPAPSSVSTGKPNGSYFPSTNSKSIHTASLSEVKSASRPLPIERSRTRDRMTAEELRRRRNGGVDDSEDSLAQKSSTKKTQQLNGSQHQEGNGYLSPTSAAQTAGRYLRDFSRSSSPLGLIPIHRDWRFFVSSAHSYPSHSIPS
jgi:hypothetical protein